MNIVLKLIKEFLFGLVQHGVITINNGTLSVIASASEDTVVDGIKYNDMGITEPNEHFAVQFKRFNEFLDDKIANGTKTEAKVAAAQNRWFIYLTPGITYPDEIYQQMFANQSRLFFASTQKGNVDDYYKMKGAWQHTGTLERKGTGEIIFGFPPVEEYLAGEWEEPSSRLIKRVPGHSVVANANYSSVTSRHWKTRFFDLIPTFAKHKYERDLARALSARAKGR